MLTEWKIQVRKVNDRTVDDNLIMLLIRIFFDSLGVEDPSNIGK